MVLALTGSLSFAAFLRKLQGCHCAAHTGLELTAILLAELPKFQAFRPGLARWFHIFLLSFPVASQSKDSLSEDCWFRPHTFFFKH